jgi:hypothetical protein
VQLLPHDEKFFELLIEQASVVTEASRLIADALSGSGQPDLRRRSAI